jgi:hypothetical protein
MNLKRVLSWAAVAAVICVPVLLPSVLAPSPVLPEGANAEAAEGPDAADQRIDIVHDVVRIDVTRPEVKPWRPRRAPGGAGAIRVYMRAHKDTNEARAASSNPLLRAVRAVAGDGKHRPAPFPSPRP